MSDDQFAVSVEQKGDALWITCGTHSVSCPAEIVIDDIDALVKALIDRVTDNARDRIMLAYVEHAMKALA